MRLAHTLLFLLLSASLRGQTPPKFEHFKIDLNAPKVDFFEAVEHIEIIPLEETESSLLGDIDYYFKTTSGFVIPNKTSDKRDRLVIFDDQGNYINEINRSGLGPEEYRNISAAWFKNGSIELFSGWSRKILRYSANGEFIETVEAKYDKNISGWAMTPSQNGYVFHQTGTPPGGSELIFTDNLLNLLAKGAPIDKPHPLPFSQRKVFSSLGKSIFYAKPLRDSIFQIIDGKAYPKFKFDFKDEWLWSNPKYTESPDIAMKAIAQESKVFMVLPDIGERHIFLTYLYNDNTAIFEKKGYIDRETGDFFRFDLRKKDKKDFSIKFLAWVNGRLVSSLSVYDAEEFLENLDKAQYTIAGDLSQNDLKYSENPVLLKIKFKDSLR